ncbi:hypothetical protein C5C45_10170 [Rathayibacter rathayi]|uniref:hypothetical protein n=1 Tax=Rathayibacter rathayi TaxID=33887 RepID=UPI000BDDC589|nr:hypothetical protein [Rathayibacter rathayi]AZZ48089.1 hypothetical protein C1O28_01820 [Rathayibacter rathayi]MWV75602.1 hypothetical protein [Rathayibacter rathayi NCPPB 2980 = VKM Ac-1601]PPF49156.1 hypothetical protein C5C08_07860 [Rathayibacter rathayi]PPG67681.1 hypothetical protein C5C16_09000 [Rathayibacter rathayi]PPG77294.1 hypothetical protein C5C15_09565 [Rathayibacter rathayi]
MQLRSPTAAALLALAIGMSGCACGTAIDIPDSARGKSATSAPTATPAPTAVEQDVDCAGALPVTTIEQDTGLPAGSVVLAAARDTCSYALAGNDSAVVLILHRGPLLETFTGEGKAIGAVPISLGTAAYWLEGLAPAPSELAVLAGGWELRIVSSIGKQSTLVDWAVSALASVGVPLAVA